MYSFEDPYSILERRHLAIYVLHSAIMGCKFHDLLMRHENTENWHPTEITRYMICYWFLFPYFCCFAMIALQLINGLFLHLRVTKDADNAAVFILVITSCFYN